MQQHQEVFVLSSIAEPRVRLETRFVEAFLASTRSRADSRPRAARKRPRSSSVDSVWRTGLASNVGDVVDGGGLLKVVAPELLPTEGSLGGRFDSVISKAAAAPARQLPPPTQDIVSSFRHSHASADNSLLQFLASVRTVLAHFFIFCFFNFNIYFFLLASA